MTAAESILSTDHENFDIDNFFKNKKAETLGQKVWPVLGAVANLHASEVHLKFYCCQKVRHLLSCVS